MINESMIFAAGLGKRMLPLTKSIPKPLIKINDNSILENNIQKLIDAKFKNIVVNAFYYHNQIISETEKFFPRLKVIIEKERLETGGGFLNAIKKKCFKYGNPIILLNGDIYWIDKNYKSLEKIRELWNPEKMDMLICLKPKENFFGYNGCGDFDLLGSSSALSSVILKKNPSYVFTGLQIIKQDIMLNIKKRIFSIKDQIFECLNKNKLYGYVDENPWFHIGTTEDLRKFQEKFK